MRRNAAVGFALALVLLGLVASGPTVVGGAGPGIQGSWYLTVTTTGGQPGSERSYALMTTFHADGTVLAANIPAEPDVPEAGDQTSALRFRSSGHGSWVETGSDAAAFAYFELVANERGDAVGTYSSSATTTIAPDGQSISGAILVDFFTAEGEQGGMISANGDFRGVRIAAPGP